MEMKAALKVLNDSIHRPQRGSSKLLVNAIEIVRREWIQVTFSFKYSPDLSPCLLEHLVHGGLDSLITNGLRREIAFLFVYFYIKIQNLARFHPPEKVLIYDSCFLGFQHKGG